MRFLICCIIHFVLLFLFFFAGKMASKKTKYTLHLDIPLLKEIINYNPFANPKKWQAVADALTENIDGAPATG